MAKRKSSATAVVTKWVRRTEGRMLAVMQTSIQDTVNFMRVPKAKGGNMPVLTGNLRRSLMASTTDMPAVMEGGTVFADQSGAISLVIAQMKLGDKLYLGFQAAYAMRQEYGFNGTDSLGREYEQKGSGFVRAAMDRWPRTVREAIQKIHDQVEGTS